MCFLPSLHICSAAPSERIFVLFYIENFYESLLRRPKFGENLEKKSGTLHEDPSMFH